LTVILERKLAVVEKRYRESQLDFERYAILAVSSIYGIDILEDNVRACRARLFEVLDAVYSRLFKDAARDRFRGAARFILDCNPFAGAGRCARLRAGCGGCQSLRTSTGRPFWRRCLCRY